jgi:hypothetical protein
MRWTQCAQVMYRVHSCAQQNGCAAVILKAGDGAGHQQLDINFDLTQMVTVVASRSGPASESGPSQDPAPGAVCGMCHCYRSI